MPDEMTKHVMTICYAVAMAFRVQCEINRGITGTDPGKAGAPRKPKFLVST